MQIMYTSKSRKSRLWSYLASSFILRIAIDNQYPLSGEKLAFINNVVGVFEAEIDTEGNVTEKSWEWK